MGEFLSFEDLSPLAPSLTHAGADIYIEDVEAAAISVAPCITDAGFEYAGVVKSILRQAVLRWHRAGDGGVTTEQQQVGPYGQTLTFDSRSHGYGSGRLYDGEIRSLRELCRKHSGIGSGRKAFTVAPR